MQSTKYTPEQTLAVVNSYASGSTVEQIAQQLNKSTKSVVAKLVREGVYVAQPKPQPQLRKLDLVQVLCAQLELDFQVLESLQKCERSALQALVDKLNQL